MRPRPVAGLAPPGQGTRQRLHHRQCRDPGSGAAHHGGRHPEGAQAGERGRPGIGPDQETARDSGAGGQTGDLLVEIDDLPQQNALKDALAQRDNLQAQLDSKEATLRNARLAYQRQQQIVARGLGSTADHDSAKATLDETLADIRALNAQRVQAEIAVDTARVNLGYTRILAPSGTVVAMPVEEGQTLNASQSTPPCSRLPSSTP